MIFSSLSWFVFAVIISRIFEAHGKDTTEGVQDLSIIFVKKSYNTPPTKPEIDKQIALGTNPNVWISGDVSAYKCNYSDGMNGLSTAYDAVSDAQICYGVWLYWDSDEGDNLMNAEWTTLRGLLSAAAYEEIIPRLEELSPSKLYE